jgi:hypothetical protein
MNIKGGLKSVKDRSSTILKKVILVEKKGLINEVALKVRGGLPIVEETGKILVKLFNAADTDGENAFKYLLKKLPDTSLDKALEDLKLNHVEKRIGALTDTFMRPNFPSFYELSDTVEGMKETSELTFDYLLNQAFLKESGTWNWNQVKKLLDTEKAGRERIDEIM